MAAIRLDTSYPDAQWFTHRFSVNGDLLQEVVVPAWCEAVRITSDALAARVTHTGSDGAALGSHYLSIFADSTLPIFKPTKKTRTVAGRQRAAQPWTIYVTAAAATSISIDPIEVV